MDIRRALGLLGLGHMKGLGCRNELMENAAQHGIVQGKRLVHRIARFSKDKKSNYLTVVAL